MNSIEGSHPGRSELARFMCGRLERCEVRAVVRLRQVIAELGALRAQLLAIHESLPISPQETAMLLGEEVMDVSTEVRSVIECVLHDSLQPAIRDLGAAAHYRPEGEQGH